MSVTLRDIAQKANVSVSTVSRVLNDYPFIGNGTRQIVWEAARDLGYSLDNLRTPPKKEPLVLLLSRHDESQGSQEISLASVERAISRGAQAICKQNEISVRLQHTQMKADEAQAYVRDMAVSGIIFLGGMVEHGFLQDLQAAQIPCVVAGSHVRPLSINSVMADYAGGMAEATTHLAQAGRRTVGLVNGSTLTSSSAEKYNGFRLALALNHLPFTPAQVVEGNFTPEEGYACTLRLLEQVPALDAIAYADDNMAMGGLTALKERGRRVPDDVAIIGFYDHQVARYTDPPLTTVYFDLMQMGAIAARRLCTLLDEPDDEPWLIVLPTKLIVRGSA